jgi:DHA3 family macrolide efflux protein-like MFS transporter
LVRFALIWWLTERTGSATTLAVAALSSRLPTIALGPFGGALIDRWNRHWVMAIADTLIALFTGLLACLYWLGIVQVWHVYIILFLRALGDTFQSPAMRASTPLMVPKEQLTRLAGMNQALEGVVRILAPPLGALLLAIWPMQSLLWLDLVTAALAVVPLLFIHIPQPEGAFRGEKGGGAHLLREVSDGFRYVWRWQGLFLLVATSGLLRLFVALASALLSLLVTDHFGGDALQFG